eukprot:6204656-Pleurochrysis_carterae.AAC.1
MDLLVCMQLSTQPQLHVRDFVQIPMLAHSGPHHVRTESMPRNDFRFCVGRERVRACGHPYPHSQSDPPALAHTRAREFASVRGRSHHRQQRRQCRTCTHCYAR